MASKRLIDLITELGETTDPAKATRTSSGAARVGKVAEQVAEQGTPDWLPLMIVGVGLALLAVAVLRPANPGAMPGSLGVHWEQQEEGAYQEPSYGRSWGTG